MEDKEIRKLGVLDESLLKTMYLKKFTIMLFWTMSPFFLRDLCTFIHLFISLLIRPPNYLFVFTNFN